MARRERAVRRNEVKADYSAFESDVNRNVAYAYERARQIGGEFGGGLDPRRRQEAADAGLVKEDLNAVANLPRMAQHHEWPASGYYMTPYLDDTRMEGERLDPLDPAMFPFNRRR